MRIWPIWPIWRRRDSPKEADGRRSEDIQERVVPWILMEGRPGAQRGRRITKVGWGCWLFGEY